MASLTAFAHPSYVAGYVSGMGSIVASHIINYFE
ncbi:hypothetical protein FP742_16875 [Vibrio parahaemolyticus]|uniref:Uncharacterized protein n=1 Tax=Vibrio parahaemolyticus serotype O3:K6 (strain RIMD 2210633) TaxID=223926 RepID=Q87KS9_VIBPA|nr:hypothetical protein A6J30_25190 [Vibrio parahaemolyticus]BAC61160.1 hypothetical protein [Vibrio parahaemolyticus RIMD 2210633]AZV69640.1 hypothetical protein D0853_00955 [Vibrio parahaemolyticus]EGQ8307497.1 hypothetical protein [Vibrio parahaemolyticus]EGQ8459302.1 hypothetical protein [Vibrio parahaemolyticus]